jgi:hypothetical protein
MKRLATSAALLTCAALLPSRALAQAPEQAPAPLPEAQSELLVPTPPEWRLRYDEARAKLVTGDFAGAAARFEELERTAVNRLDLALAREQRTLASEWASRGLAFVQRQDLGETPMSAKAVDKRTTDELVTLYTSSVLYGLGTGAWVATLTKPATPAAAILPTFALTGAAVGTVIGLDSGRGMRYGVPQSVVTGLNVGFEHGLVWSLWLDMQDGSADGATISTLIWSASTVGAFAGGVLGHTLGTTPGRSSWVGSTALWGGTVIGLATGALGGDGKTGTQTALAAGGVGLSLGTAVGMTTASHVSPSIALVRFLDLGAVAGGLLGAGLYLAGANDSADGNATAGITALGVTAGLASTWFLTASMPEDRPRPAVDAAPPSALAKLRPMLMPATGGAMMGLGGALD